MHKVFISFHHANDQFYKDELVKFSRENDIFHDESVEMGEIPDDWNDKKIRFYIRDEHLRDTTVTILLVGTETKHRKHVDWEIHSSMFNGTKNKKSGIIVILLPSVKVSPVCLSYDNEKESIRPYVTNWINISERTEFENRYPFLPDIIIDNLLNSESKISVVNWSDINVSNLSLMIDNAYNNREKCKYDISRPMRRNNS